MASFPLDHYTVEFLHHFLSLILSIQRPNFLFLHLMSQKTYQHEQERFAYKGTYWRKVIFMQIVYKDFLKRRRFEETHKNTRRWKAICLQSMSYRFLRRRVFKESLKNTLRWKPFPCNQCPWAFSQRWRVTCEYILEKNQFLAVYVRRLSRKVVLWGTT